MQIVMFQDIVCKFTTSDLFYVYKMHIKFYQTPTAIYRNKCIWIKTSSDFMNNLSVPIIVRHNIKYIEYHSILHHFVKLVQGFRTYGMSKVAFCLVSLCLLFIISFFPYICL